MVFGHTRHCIYIACQWLKLRSWGNSDQVIPDRHAGALNAADHFFCPLPAFYPIESPSWERQTTKKRVPTDARFIDDDHTMARLPTQVTINN